MTPIPQNLTVASYPKAYYYIKVYTLCKFNGCNIGYKRVLYLEMSLAVK